METRAHYVAVGAFVLSLIALAFIAVLWIGRTQLTTQYAKYDIYFTGPVTGLTQGSAVDFNGIQVGRVSEIAIASVERIRVRIEIQQDVPIKTNTVAALEANILSGVATIQLQGGTREAPTLVAEAGEPYPVIKSRRSSLEQLYARAPQLLNKLMDVADNLNAVLGEHNQKALASSLDNIQTLTANAAGKSEDLAETITNAKSAMAALGKLLSNVDESYSGRNGLKDQLAVVLADFDRLAKGLLDTNRQIQATVQDARPVVRQFGAQTLPQVSDLISDARHLAAGLTRLAETIERDPTRFLFGDRREGYRPK
ncbi:MAG TPA: MlaD family protein [Stellaceae bacterium]|nr:MlaD family protein [Stellaceae bacterium]